MDSYQKRKAERKSYYERFVKGWKLRDCSSCSGSSCYCGGPCGACEGTGKERFKIENEKAAK